MNAQPPSFPACCAWASVLLTFLIQSACCAMQVLARIARQSEFGSQRVSKQLSGMNRLLLTRNHSEQDIAGSNRGSTRQREASVASIAAAEVANFSGLTRANGRTVLPPGDILASILSFKVLIRLSVAQRALFSGVLRAHPV